jgi:RHS repeat-associated protein
VRSEKRGPVIYGSYVDELLAILPASGVVGDRKFVHSNHLYSVAALTDNSGNVVERYRYDAYGQRTVLAADGVTVRAASSYGNQYGFTGRYQDKETGLWYFRARYYSGSLGRFVSRDDYSAVWDSLGASPIWSHGISDFKGKLWSNVFFMPKKQVVGAGYPDGYNAYSTYFIPNKVDPTGRVAGLAECGKAISVQLEGHVECGRGERQFWVTQQNLFPPREGEPPQNNKVTYCLGACAKFRECPGPQRHVFGPGDVCELPVECVPDFDDPLLPVMATCYCMAMATI